MMRIILLSLVALSTSHCQQLPSKKIRFDFTIREDDKTAVSNANVRFTFGRIPEANQVVHQGLSDAQGKFMAEDDVVFGLLLTIHKEGYYSIYERDPLKSIALDQYENLRQHNMELTMRQIKSPIPLCGKVVNRAVPEQNKPIGYDLLIGDWVKPYGKGANGDFFVSYNNKCDGFKDGRKLDELIKLVKDWHLNNPSSKESYFDGLKRFYEKEQDYTYEDGAYQSMGHWNGKIQITFPNKDEGITEVKDGFHSYSELTMPHEAPENGYQKDWSREEDNAGARLTSSEIGYFLRTRVKHDEKGKIVSANYAKIVTDFNFDPRGRLEFSYLFNPTPNDRNLEFDPKKNLFKNLEFREEIRKP